MTAGWRILPLGDLCEILDSQRRPITKRDRDSGEYPYYGATGIQDYVSGYLFDEPLVLVGEDGAKWEAGDNTAFHVNGRCWVNNHAHVLRPNRNVLLDSWLVYFLVFSDLTEFVSGLTVPKLNQGSLRQIPIPVPPVEVQQRIVAILDEAFEGIATAKADAEKNLQNAKALFESHLQGVFSRRGDGWVERRLQDVFAIGSSKRVLERDWVKSGVPFYGGREVVQLSQSGETQAAAHISEEKYREIASTYGVPAEGDILLTARGTIGVGYIVKGKDKFYYKDGNLMCLHPKEPAEPRFLLYAFRSRTIKDQLGVLTGATVTHLPIEKANALVMPFPSFATQQSVVAVLQQAEEEAVSLARKYEAKLSALDDLKKSLLHHAFSGQL